MEHIAWHPAFYLALQIELQNYSDVLEFISEYELSKEPQRIDVLIVKKTTDVKIEKNIGNIFRGHNIIEFKSPKDYISIDDFYKIYGYACQYKAITGKVDEIPIDDITISLVSKTKPKKLLSYLENTRNRTIQKIDNGIYHILGDTIPIQIIVSKELTQEDNLFLANLTDEIKKEELSKIFKICTKNLKDTKYQEYLTTVTMANKRTLMEVLNMENGLTPDLVAGFEEIMAKFGIAERIKASGIAEGKEEGKKEGMIEIAISLMDILNDEVIAQKTKLPLEEIQELRKKHKNHS